jgi:hypothetical protein
LIFITAPFVFIGTKLMILSTPILQSNAEFQFAGCLLSH